MKFILVGGAPLSAETHDFIRTCLGVVLVQVRQFNLRGNRMFWAIET